jgi:predicted RNA-binding protein with PUA-like domain
MKTKNRIQYSNRYYDRIPKARSRKEELRLLRLAHASEFQLELEERSLREQTRALAWQVERAAQRLSLTPVSPEEQRAHLQAAKSLGSAYRQLLWVISRRRRFQREIRVRTIYYRRRR